MASKPEQLNERNREIGALLAQVRCQQQRSVTECAALLGTSRRRYRAIERGEIGVEAAELEVLAHYLDVPMRTMWQEDGEQPVRRVITIRPGEVLYVRADEGAA